MKKIPLSQGQFALVDDSDFDLIMQHKWCAAKWRHSFYACRKPKEMKSLLLMHRYIYNISDPKVFVDHIDHNGLNNQRINLRIVTNGQNQMNQSMQRGGKSKFKGVSIYRNKFRTRITVNGILHTIGYFPNSESGEISAAKAYNEAAKIHFGEFANLNILP